MKFKIGDKVRLTKDTCERNNTDYRNVYIVIQIDIDRYLIEGINTHLRWSTIDNHIEAAHSYQQDNNSKWF